MKKSKFEEKSKLWGKFKDSSNFNKGNIDYEGILNGKNRINLVIVMLTIKDSSNFNKETYIMRGFLMEKS